MTPHLCDILFTSPTSSLAPSQSVPDQSGPVQDILSTPLQQERPISMALYRHALRILAPVLQEQACNQPDLQPHCQCPLGQGLFYLGMAYFTDQNYDIAHILWDLSAYLFDEVGHQYGEAKALYYAGLAACHRGDDEQAVICLEHARILNLVLDQTEAEALTLTWLGHIYTRQQHTKMAMCCYWDAGTLCQQGGDRLGELLNYAYLGYVFELEEMPLSALDTYRQAIALLQTMAP